MTSDHVVDPEPDDHDHDDCVPAGVYPEPLVIADDNGHLLMLNAPGVIAAVGLHHGGAMTYPFGISTVQRTEAQLVERLAMTTPAQLIASQNAWQAETARKAAAWLIAHAEHLEAGGNPFANVQDYVATCEVAVDSAIALASHVAHERGLCGCQQHGPEQP